MKKLDPFHLAIPVHDLEAAREFYGQLMDCPEGRSDQHWVDFNFFGHQLVCHLDENHVDPHDIENPVDGHDVPVPHFGVVLSRDDWKWLADRLLAFGATFIIEPNIRFRGQPGEQASFFLRDPSGNALEFKSMHNRRELFARQSP